MKEGERGPFFPKLRVRIKDNNSSPHGKFYRFLFPFSSKFSDLNFASYVLYIYLHTVSLGYLCLNLFVDFIEINKIAYNGWYVLWIVQIVRTDKNLW